MFPFDIITFVYLKKNNIQYTEILYDDILMTPLIYAIYILDIKYFDYLIKNVDINELSSNNDTPLNIAISIFNSDKNKSIYFIKQLLNHNANPNLQNHTYHPIQNAQLISSEIVDILLQYDTKLYNNDTINDFIEIKDVNQVINDIKSNNIDDINITHNKKFILYTAIINNNIQLVILLLQYGAKINKKYNGLSLLYISYINNYFDIFKLLLDNDINLNVKIDKKPLLAILIENNDFNYIELILKYNVNINILDDNNNNLLYYCITYNRPKILILLLQNNIKVNKKFNNGNNILTTSVIDKKLNFVKIIIENSDINFEFKNYDNKTALELAIKNKFYSIAKLLKKYHTNNDINDLIKKSKDIKIKALILI